MLTVEKKAEKSTYLYSIHSRLQRRSETQTLTFVEIRIRSFLFVFIFIFRFVFVSLPLYLSCSVALIRQGESTTREGKKRANKRWQKQRKDWKNEQRKNEMKKKIHKHKHTHNHPSIIRLECHLSWAAMAYYIHIVLCICLLTVSVDGYLYRIACMYSVHDVRFTSIQMYTQTHIYSHSHIHGWPFIRCADNSLSYTFNSYSTSAQWKLLTCTHSNIKPWNRKFKKSMWQKQQQQKQYIHTERARREREQKQQHTKNTNSNNGDDDDGDDGSDGTIITPSKRTSL